MARRTTSHIEQLYAPQFEQFGLVLEPGRAGAVLQAQVVNQIGAGSAWIMPISKDCLVMEHVVTPAHDMRLLEQTFEPYACASLMNASTLSCMPQNGIVPGYVAPREDTRPKNSAGTGDTLCTFVQSNLHDQYSPLKAGMTYRSRSVLFLSGFFDELEQRWPGEFTGLFDAFDGHWPEEARTAMTHALRRLSYPRADQAGACLRLRSVVDTMVAELACAHAAEKGARQAQGTRASASLATQAAALIEQALDEGIQLGVDEAAARLYVSRSKLCAVFKAETGEGLAAYARRRRIERARELLADGALSVAQVAARLGYQRQSAFSQAFKQACGVSPTQWREGYGQM